MEKQESADHNSQMAPKMNESDFPKNELQSEENGDNDDLEEIQAVSDSLDEISRALDFIESRTDNVMAEALAWLANRTNSRIPSDEISEPKMDTE